MNTNNNNSRFIPFHHTCVGYTAPWWKPQIECSLCRLTYIKPDLIRIPYEQPKKKYSEEGHIR